MTIPETVKAVFGNDYLVTSVTPVRGGTQKTVHRITCSNGFMFLHYAWDDDKNLFQEEMETSKHLFSIDSFLDNGKQIRSAGIAVPDIYYASNETRTAFVECITGPDFQRELERGTEADKKKVSAEAVDVAMALHELTRKSWGTVRSPEAGSCIEPHEKEAYTNLQFISSKRKLPLSALHSRLSLLAADIEPRNNYAFVHGELGPNHLLRSSSGEPVLIDIEGARYYDREYELSFMSFRYPYWETPATCDQNRFHYYLFGHHLSLAAGAIKLQERGYEDQNFARTLEAFHLKRLQHFPLLPQ
ncbi:phosphotransferase [Bacillus daqingensis]|uniref:Phosphotransferase n=1 Tax=Bacillus daqingensis TaxID=872396 RepID=A0ABV9NPG8_9BACI